MASPIGMWDENIWMRRYFGSASKGTTNYVLYLHQAGWPLRAMQSEYWLANDHSQDPPAAWAKEKGIRTGLRHKNGDPRLLPTRFITVGWLADSAMFGALLLAVSTGPRLLRKLHRARRGDCLQCGYDRRNNPGPCPECGAA